MSLDFAPPENRPGFAGYEHTSLRATVYRRGGGILRTPGTPLVLETDADARSGAHVIAASVQNAIGQGGTYQLTVKCPTGMDLTEMVQDDDWVDIEIGMGATFWHVMRGLVDEVRRSISVAGGGATSSSYLIAGQSFQKVWANTPLWFSAVRAENIGGVQLQAIQGIGLNVPDTVASFLFDYTNRVAQMQRSGVALPDGMPGAGADFPASWRLDQTQFDDSDAPRINLLKNFLAPSSNIWEVGSGWGDPYYCECFTELLPAVPQRPSTRPPDPLGRVQSVNAVSAYAALGAREPHLPLGLSPSQSAPTLVVRNKPFIAVSLSAAPRVGMNSPWFDLPMYSVPKQHLLSVDIGRSGYERTNAYFSAAMLSDSGSSLSTRQISYPLWSVSDMRVHGIRIMDAVSRYEPDVTRIDPDTYLTRLRAKLRDWYMANPAYYQGSVALGRIYPEMRIGTRLRLLGDSVDDQITFYVESLSHNFTAGSGARTTVGVTRGYKGSDSAHVASLYALANDYTEPAG